MNEKRKQNALKVINGHRGKKIVYETYLRNNPEMAQKYLEYISKNEDARYIKWDSRKEKFI